VRWAGQNGIFWRGFDSIAEALGKSVRQVKTDVAVLEAKGLIRHTSRRRNSNVYEFLWHALFEVRQTAFQQSGFEVQDSHLEVQPTARESSPLESSLNSVKADNKRISGHASQKSRSAASLRVLCSQDLESEPSKADVPSQASAGPGPLKGEGPADGWTSEELDRSFPDRPVLGTRA